MGGTARQIQTETLPSKGKYVSFSGKELKKQQTSASREIAIVSVFANCGS
jgi:hypothetical protein